MRPGDDGGRSRQGPGWGIVAAIGLALPVGCGSPKPATNAPVKQPFRGTTVVVAAMGDQAILPGIDAQRGEWVASTGAELTLKPEPAVDPLKLGGIDVLIFPGDRLGDLVDAGALLPLDDATLGLTKPAATHPGVDATSDPDSDASTTGKATQPPPDPLALDGLAPPYRDLASKYGDERECLPLGGSGLVLVYRRAAFDRAANREAAGAAKIALEPPKTWEELDALAKFFRGQDWDGDGKPDAGIALPLGLDPEGVGDAIFLARAAAIGQHRDQYTFLFDADRMGPRVASPPFVEALAGLVGLAKLGPAGGDQFDAPAARAAFRSGAAPLLIDRAERFRDWSGGELGPIGVAPLPGSRRVFDPGRKEWEESKSAQSTAYLPRGGGWFVGVVAGSAHREAAVSLARSLAGPESTERLRCEAKFPMLPTRGAGLAAGLTDPKSAPGVDARGWSEAVARTINATRVVIGLRIPGADGYLADLAKARGAAVAGIRPVEGALADLAKAWDARTDGLGRDRQTWHYRRSLNRLITTPSPPPRGE